jgi:hypothetical protein
LKRLRDEGYEVAIRHGYLVVSHVPYATSRRDIAFGTLVSTLQLAGEVTATPETHVVHFQGEYPCTRDGVEIEQLRHQADHRELGEGLPVNYSFSNKPPEGFPDYHAKMTTYIEVISAHARAIDPCVTARTFEPVTTGEEDMVFRYIDTASSRADIVAVAGRLRNLKVGVVGLGGTGSYVLDLVAKTPVREIHLFDGDLFLQHNAFRGPGAPSLEQLREKPKKTDYFKAIYDRMHGGVVSHPVNVDSTNVGEVLGLDFVFVCIDRGALKGSLYDQLEARGIPFVDVGMGVQAVGGTLLGVVRSTLSTRDRRDHVRRTVSFDDPVADDYTSAIQIADLNMLNAALAVISWKKLYGVYQDLERAHSITYSTNVNMLLGEDQ